MQIIDISQISAYFDKNKIAAFNELCYTVHGILRLMHASICQIVLPNQANALILNKILFAWLYYDTKSVIQCWFVVTTIRATL